MKRCCLTCKFCDNCEEVIRVAQENDSAMVSLVFSCDKYKRVKVRGIGNHPS